MRPSLSRTLHDCGGCRMLYTLFFLYGAILSEAEGGGDPLDQVRLHMS